MQAQKEAEQRSTIGVPNSWFAKPPSSKPKAKSGENIKKISAIVYLRDVLGLPEATLEYIALNWPSMAFYNAQDHIIPTIKVTKLIN